MSPDQQFFPFIKLDVIDSTNNYAMNLVKDGWAKNLACIWALDQNMGKGQRGNIWQSEAGKNLTCSIIFFPDSLNAGNSFYLSMAACLAAKKFLESSCMDVKIKWPNDLLVSGKKAGGILIENILEKQIIRSSVIGIGINLNQREFPPDIPNVSSVFINSGKISDIEQSVHSLYSEMTGYLKKLDMKHYDELRQSYLQSLFGLDLQLNFRDSNGEFEGTILGVEETGEILIKTKAEQQRRYSFKEVEMII